MLQAQRPTTPPYRDRKRYAWLLSLVVPCTVGVGPALMAHGSEAQKRAVLPKIAEGSLRLQAFGVSEPTSGTDTSRIRTTAVHDGDGYLINGQKVWTSRAEHSDLLLLLARTSPREAVALYRQVLALLHEESASAAA